MSSSKGQHENVVQLLYCIECNSWEGVSKGRLELP